MAAGAAALAVTADQWSQLELGVVELGLFIALAGILDVMVVPVPGGGAMAASFAVFFAGVLALGAQPTAWVAALAVMWSEGVVRRRPVSRACFNASHSVLSLLAVGWVYGALGGQVGWVELKQHWVAVVGAALVLWALETGWASMAVALERGGRLWRRLRSWVGPGLAWDGGLASVGLLLALLYQSRWHLVGHSGWQGALLLGATVLIPSALLYYAYRLQESLQEVYSQSLRTLGALLEAKVEGSQLGHGERVAALAAGLSESLELPHREVAQIRYAGYLHDIGKVGVPSTLLSRSRDRFEGEPEAVKLHAQIGAGILSPIRFLQPAAQIVTSHQRLRGHDPLRPNSTHPTPSHLPPPTSRRLPLRPRAGGGAAPTPAQIRRGLSEPGRGPRVRTSLIGQPRRAYCHGGACSEGGPRPPANRSRCRPRTSGRQPSFPCRPSPAGGRPRAQRSSSRQHKHGPHCAV
jgi:hypothetical protein